MDGRYKGANEATELPHKQLYKTKECGDQEKLSFPRKDTEIGQPITNEFESQQGLAILEVLEEGTGRSCVVIL